MKMIGLLSATALLLTCPAGWAGEASIAKGQALFASTELGSNGKACATCHPDGKGLQEIDAYSDPQLREMINFCIRDAQKGTMLPLDSPKIESLLLYLRSLPN